MDASEFADAVESEMATELGRLGSGKLLVALTGADLSAGTVAGVAVARARGARGTFREWAEDATDERARATFETAADSQDRAVERLTAEFGGDRMGESDPGGDPAVDRLREFSTTAERAGGLLGWSLVADRADGQFVAFFVNEAATGRADLFRELRADVEEGREAAVDLLAALDGSDGDEDSAREAAEGVVRAAYDDYTERLEGMGLDPKPVC